MSRKLATIRTIHTIHPIPKADRIEVACIDGWECVIRKDEFKVGDEIVYFEIDTVLPSTNKLFAFMEKRKYRVRTIKLRGQLSQGLILKKEECGLVQSYKPGTDVTEILKVTKYEAGSSKVQGKARTATPKRRFQWLKRYAIGRRLLAQLYKTPEAIWPSNIPKTDEDRVQNLSQYAITCRIENGVTMTEKLDGQSCTIFYDMHKQRSFFKKGVFGVCSRNVHYPTRVANNWWNITIKHDLNLILPGICKLLRHSLAIQGEIVGEGIQGNKYKLKGQHFYLFSAYDMDAGEYLDPVKVAELLRIPTVPVLSTATYLLDADRAGLLELADGKSVIGCKPLREGIVIRSLVDQSQSFKCISNKWLLKNEK